LIPLFHLPDDRRPNAEASGISIVFKFTDCILAPKRTASSNNNNHNAKRRKTNAPRQAATDEEEEEEDVDEEELPGGSRGEIEMDQGEEDQERQCLHSIILFPANSPGFQPVSQETIQAKAT